MMTSTKRGWCAALVFGVLFVVPSGAQHDQPPAGAVTPDLSALVETVVYDYGPFELAPKQLQQFPPNYVKIAFPEDLWILGYQARVVDERGAELPQELQCHTFFGTPYPQHHVVEQVAGIFSDGYTERSLLPPGFGILAKAGEEIKWVPLFNNRTSEPKKVSMKLTLEVVRARLLPEGGLKALQTVFRTIAAPHDLYYVAPGSDTRETTFDLPFVGRIHFMGTHIHPFGVSIELVNLTRDAQVWKAVGRRDKEGKLVEMPIYSDREGYAVRAGDRFKLIAIYENPTQDPIDAMAGIFILFAPEDTPTAP